MKLFVFDGEIPPFVLNECDLLHQEGCCLCFLFFPVDSIFIHLISRNNSSPSVSRLSRLIPASVVSSTHWFFGRDLSRLFAWSQFIGLAEVWDPWSYLLCQNSPKEVMSIVSSTRCSCFHTLRSNHLIVSWIHWTINQLKYLFLCGGEFFCLMLEKQILAIHSISNNITSKANGDRICYDGSLLFWK